MGCAQGSGCQEGVGQLQGSSCCQVGWGLREQVGSAGGARGGEEGGGRGGGLGGGGASASAKSLRGGSCLGGSPQGSLHCSLQRPPLPLPPLNAQVGVALPHGPQGADAGGGHHEHSHWGSSRGAQGCRAHCANGEQG